jgi:hypothetical protein
MFFDFRAKTIFIWTKGEYAKNALHVERQSVQKALGKHLVCQAYIFDNL